MAIQGSALWVSVWSRIELLSSYEPYELQTSKGVDLVRLGLSDPIRIFNKDEPTRADKALNGDWRAIWSVSLIDQLVDRILFQQIQTRLTAQWPYLPVQVGIGFSDDMIKDFVRQFRKDSFINSDDTKKWDFCVLEQDLFMCAIITFRAFDRSPLSAKETRSLYNCVLNRALCISRKLGVLSDGSVFDQMDHTHAGIMSSGVFMTAFWNSIIRAEAARIVFRRLSIPLVMVKSMGDDCNTEADQLVESDRLAKEYLTLGKLMHFSQVSRPGEPFEFCSQLYDRMTETAVPTSWPRMLFRLLGKKPSPELLCSYNYELRNLDKALKQKLDDFLFEVGWCLKNITQAAMPKKAAAKSVSKTVNKKIKSEVKKDVKKAAKSAVRAGSAYYQALIDPFRFGVGAKIPDLQTGLSATFKSYLYLPVTILTNGYAATMFDPVNFAAWRRTATAVAAGGAITWGANTPAPNWVSMSTAITPSIRLVNAGIMYMPSVSLTASAGYVTMALTPQTAANVSNVGNISTITNAVSFPASRACSAHWTPRDFSSFEYWPFPVVSGVANNVGVDNMIYFAVAGSTATAGTVVGVIILVANYEVVVADESQTILTSTESPSDFPQMEFAANKLSDGQWTRDLGFEGGIGDSFSSPAYQALYRQASDNTSNRWMEREIHHLHSGGGGSLSAMRYFSSAGR